MNRSSDFLSVMLKFSIEVFILWEISLHWFTHDIRCLHSTPRLSSDRIPHDWLNIIIDDGSIISEYDSDTEIILNVLFIYLQESIIL